MENFFRKGKIDNKVCIKGPGYLGVLRVLVQEHFSGKLQREYIYRIHFKDILPKGQAS